MAHPSHVRPTITHQPALAFFAGIGSVWVFLLVTLGAFTTSIGAGMAFPDWPLSNGSINPAGWLQDISMFAEHSHRLSGMMMGFITIGLAVWLWRRDERPWLRQLGFWALGIVILQGIIGGQRVKLNAISVPWFHMSLGEMLRIPHGILAQIYVCVLIAIALSCSKSWIERRLPVGPGVRAMGLACTALLFVQLVIATTMRHNGAGLAIPVFPYSTPPPENHWLPHDWTFGVALHFAHRAMALILTFALTAFAWVISRDRAATLALKVGAGAMLLLLVLQISLGAQIIWTLRRPEMTTGHVVVGALTLAVTFYLTWLAHRDVIERRSFLGTPLAA